MTENSEVEIFKGLYKLFFVCEVSLNSGKYRPWMLATTPFFVASGLESTLIPTERDGALQSHDTYEQYLFWGIYNGCLWETVLCVSILQEKSVGQSGLT